MNYLSELKNLIEEVVPIKGLYYDGIEVKAQFYKDNKPSATQLEQINYIVNNYDISLKQKKYNYEQNLKFNWSSKLQNGWETSQGWSLGIDVSDVALLNGAFTLAKEASNLGLTTPVSIIDTDGISHDLNLNELTQLMLSYGQARSQLSNIYATKLNQIKNASSIEELESLDLTI